MNISVVYKPPKSNVTTVTDFFKDVHQDLFVPNGEIWLLGDFNTDFLVRDSINTKKLVIFFRNNGLSQLISEITRPNKFKGTCIDWIITNSLFVLHSGVSNVLISDHLTVFCVRKKKRENTCTVYRVFRDLKNYSQQNFINLLRAQDYLSLLPKIPTINGNHFTVEYWKFCLSCAHSNVLNSVSYLSPG